MGTLSNPEKIKVLSYFGIPDQGSRKDNLRKLKEIIATLPVLPIKEDSPTPAPETITSRDAPERLFSSSSIYPLLPSESSSISTTSSVASIFSRASSASSRTSTASTRPSTAISASTDTTATTVPESPPSRTAGKNTRDASPSQPQRTGHAMGLSLIRRDDESSASYDRIPAEGGSEVGRREKEGEMRRENEKVKGKEVENSFGGLPAVQETEDLYDVPPVPRTLLSDSFDPRTDPNIGPSHSKAPEKPTQDPETNSRAEFTVAESSSSSASKVTFAQPVDVNSCDAKGKGTTDLWDLEDFDDDDDLAEWRVDNPVFDSDDDEVAGMGSSLEEDDKTIAFTEKEWNFFLKAWNSVTEAYDRNLKMGISYEETGNRLYRGDVLVQE